MENTMKVGEKFLVDHRKSLSGTWKRGDIVLIETISEEWGEDTVVKRVIGLPGETIEIVNGQVMVDGKAITEPYLKEPAEAENIPPVVLGAGQYYVMGDNRNNSADSRQHGPVANAEIRGRVTRKFWPMQALPRPTYSD
jgi:signal peptidase I